MEYTRISADCHIDLCWLPPTLFTDGATPAMKSRMPYVASGPRGDYWTTPSGVNLGLKNGVGPTGAPYVPGQHARVDRMAETGLYRDGEQGIRRVSDPHLRVRDMDLDCTVHGFRSSFRDWVAEETHYQGEVAEAALAREAMANS